MIDTEIGMYYCYRMLKSHCVTISEVAIRYVGALVVFKLNPLRDSSHNGDKTQQVRSSVYVQLLIV